ncbi:hypothetical protein [Oryzifoliimicrobium ureilyticus]|uniref:hypothetical protein n=1 Tax=Oryzifoliimicrobium ureilyticus TaxID=3113724 RepID=UPI00307669AD
MKPLVRVLAAFVWLGLSVLSAEAGISADNQKESAAAFQTLDAAARETRKVGSMPRLSNADQAKVLSRFWNAESTLGNPPYRATDIPGLMTVGERAALVFKSYALFTAQPGGIPDTNVNAAAYQGEISRAGAYLLKVFAAELEAATDFFATLPKEQMNDARRNGLRQMRLGIMQEVTGIALMLRSPDLRPENRRVLLDALTDTAPSIAAATTPLDRQAMVAQVGSLLPALNDEERAKAETLKNAFAGQDCTGLCLISDQ